MPRVIKRKGFKYTTLYAPNEWSTVLQRLKAHLSSRFQLQSFASQHGRIGLNDESIHKFDQKITGAIEGLRYSNILDPSIDIDSEIREIIRYTAGETEKMNHDYLEQLYNQWDRAEERKNQSDMQIIEGNIERAQRELEDVSRYATELWNIGENNANPMDEGAGIHRRRTRKKQRKIKIK